MRIVNNIAALNATNIKAKNTKALSKSIENLSSGLRINKAADDAAGLAISQKMRAQIRGLSQASRNAQDGISLVQTAEGGLSVINDPYLQRLRELAIQASNDTLVDSDREKIQMEVENIIQAIDDTANNTQFNGINLLNVPDGGKIETVVSKVIDVTVNAGESITAGFIEVSSPAVPSTLTVKANFGTISGADWPDLNIVSPNGETFGYSYMFVPGSVYQEDTTNNSSSKVTYTGYLESNEEYSFENPISGKWNLEVRNTGGSLSSTFSLESNYLINSGKEIVVETKIPGELKLQVGSNYGDNFIVDLSDVRSKVLGIADLVLTTRINAQDSILKIDDAINTVVSERSKYGAYQNALEHVIRNVDNSAENLQAAESRITDLDMAKGVAEMTKLNILSQAADAMIAQANQQPQGILQLLK